MEVTKHPVILGAAPTTKNYLGQNVNIAKAEKPTEWGQV